MWNHKSQLADGPDAMHACLCCIASRCIAYALAPSPLPLRKGCGPGRARQFKRCRTALQVWVKPSAEMQFLYGNHVLKNGLGRITENTPAYTGVVVYSMSGARAAGGTCARARVCQEHTGTQDMFV